MKAVRMSSIRGKILYDRSDPLANMSKVPPSGVWCPAVTFFTAQDTLDLDAQARYFSYLSITGIAGLVVLGTNAETSSSRERRGKRSWLLQEEQ